jgi:hypothetical protein
MFFAVVFLVLRLGDKTLLKGGGLLAAPCSWITTSARWTMKTKPTRSPGVLQGPTYVYTAQSGRCERVFVRECEGERGIDVIIVPHPKPKPPLVPCLLSSPNSVWRHRRPLYPDTRFKPSAYSFGWWLMAGADLF